MLIETFLWAIFSPALFRRNTVRVAHNGTPRRIPTSCCTYCGQHFRSRISSLTRVSDKRVKKNPTVDTLARRPISSRFIRHFFFFFFFKKRSGRKSIPLVVTDFGPLRSGATTEHFSILDKTPNFGSVRHLNVCSYDIHI